jgi:hypothetical protein
MLPCGAAQRSVSRYGAGLATIFGASYSPDILKYLPALIWKISESCNEALKEFHKIISGLWRVRAHSFVQDAIACFRQVVEDLGIIS